METCHVTVGMHKNKVSKGAFWEQPGSSLGGSQEPPRHPSAVKKYPPQHLAFFRALLGTVAI